MKRLVDWWLTYMSKEDVEKHILSFRRAKANDKKCMISDSFGIFDGSIKGHVYTYYFHNCDTLNYKYRGTKKWYKGADIFKVDYNFITDDLTVTKCKRFNKRATENRCRML